MIGSTMRKVVIGLAALVSVVSATEKPQMKNAQSMVQKSHKSTSKTSTSVKKASTAAKKRAHLATEPESLHQVKAHQQKKKTDNKKVQMVVAADGSVKQDKESVESMMQKNRVFVQSRNGTDAGGNSTSSDADDSGDDSGDDEDSGDDDEEESSAQSRFYATTAALSFTALFALLW